MTITSAALKAYANPLVVGRVGQAKPAASEQAVRGFGETLKESLQKVNEMEAEKSAMIKEFAAGEPQNIHELMITMQKAGMAMKMTSAIRNKVMESYKEIMHMQF